MSYALGQQYMMYMIGTGICFIESLVLWPSFIIQALMMINPL